MPAFPLLKKNSGRSLRAAFGGSSLVEVELDPPSLVARILIALLRGYKVLASPLFVGSCRFHPSCSDYASEAVRRHGALAGGWLALGRLARCQPLCHGGYDPVPAKVRQSDAARHRTRA